MGIKSSADTIVVIIVIVAFMTGTIYGFGIGRGEIPAISAIILAIILAGIACAILFT